MPEQPETVGTPRGPWRGEVRQVLGTTFLARAASNHWVVMDSGTAAGGSGAGASPKELVLLALGGCTAHDVVAILRKKRAPLERLVVSVSAEEREEHPRIFTAIHLEYIFRGSGLREHDIERAIELSETKYCSVSAMLRGVATITTSWRIENEPPAAG